MKFEFAEPSEAGVNPLSVGKLLDMFINGGIFANAMVLIRNGKIFCEFYRTPYSSEKYHAMASATKSIVSIAAGFAVSEGLIDVNDSVISYFGDILKEPVDENMKLMKIENLLTMTCGLDGEFQGNEYNDIIKKFLLAPVLNKPGEKFAYNTDAVNVLAQIIEKASGVKFDKYVHEHLFKPLEIENYLWENETGGIVNAGFGLHLRAQDLAKIGLLMLNGGKWDGIQILDSEWIERSGSALSNGGDYGYGYLFWKHKTDKSYMMHGLGGQRCVIMPKYNMVIVLLDAANGNTLQSICDIILPELDSGGISETENTILIEKCKKIVVEMPKGAKHNGIEKNVSGRKYALEENSLCLTHIAFNFDKYEMTLYENEKSCVCKIGYDEWIESETYADPRTACTLHFCALHSPVSIAGAWEGGIYHMKQVYTTMPMIDDMYITFSDDFSGINIDYKRSEKTFFNPDKIIKGTEQID
jgi:CubicO group peptidase (beta-lactamase class C family)